MTLLRVLAAAAALAAAARPAAAQDDEKLTDRAKRAGEVLAELVKISDNSPPNSLLEQALCVAVVPGLKQGGFGFGAKAGFGLASCRTPGGWRLPTFMGLKGGSFGLQIGYQSADIVLLIVSETAMKSLASSSFTLGGEVSVAAGPVGRNLQAGTDFKLSSAIYSYSRTKGVFAGIALAGTKWEIDSKANRSVYGAIAEKETAPNKEGGVAYLLKTPATKAPGLIEPFLTSLETHVGPGKRAVN